MTAFPRFDPYAVLAEDKNRDRESTPAKAAKPAKADAGEEETLATLAALATPTPQTENPARWSEVEEERAGIVEHDGKIPRAWAEGFARLYPNRPPRDMPTKRWLRFIDDVGHFLDGPFCTVAASLGWGSHDLFGCDRDRAFARIDRAGLLWILNGDRLVAFAENTATIETRVGARHTYRRRPGDAGRVLAWELADGEHK